MARSTGIHLRKIARPDKNGKKRYEWHLRWHETTGRHRCEKIGDCSRMTRREAEKIRRDYQVQMDRGEVPRDAPKEMTITEFAEFHQKMIAGDRQPSTLYEYRLSAHYAADALGKVKKIQDITPIDVGRLKAKLKGSAATRAKHLSRLRAMFNHARRWGLIHGDNPFANQPMPRFSPRKMRIFTPEEIRTMIDVAKTPWWKAFIAVAATSGLRREEILNLMWSDVDFENLTIAVTAKTSTLFETVDGEQLRTIAWHPKTYAVRTVPIPDFTVELLKGLRTRSDDSPYCFLSIDRLRRLYDAPNGRLTHRRSESCNNVLRDFAALQRRVAQRLDQRDWTIGTIHDLRRTFGTTMANVVPLHVLQQWMGHSDISTTATFYLNTDSIHSNTARATYSTNVT